MSGALLDIRRRIKSTKNTQQITKAMKMVSASRLRRAEERARSARPYAERLAEVHGSILARLPEVDQPLYRQGHGRTLLVVVSGDKGLCGSFNSNVLKHARTMIDEGGVDNFAVLPIGKKSVAAFKKEAVETLPGYENIFRDVTVALAEEIANRLVEAFLENGYAKVILLFNKFKNVLIQEVTEQQALPLSAESGGEAPSGPEHLAEPGLEEILADLSPRVALTTVYQALLESCASEHAARMTAMDAATKNAKELIEKLTLDLNKARQAAITKELIEVVSGAAAL